MNRISDKICRQIFLLSVILFFIACQSNTKKAEYNEIEPTQFINTKISIDNDYELSLNNIRESYRIKLSELILTADKVELYIVKFDGLEKGPKSPFSEDDSINVSPYDSHTKIIQKKTLKSKEKMIS